MVTVRVYVVRAIDLQPQDTNGGCDAYICISANGKRLLKDSKNYIPASLNPIFGRSYDVELMLPQQSEISVSVWDHDNFNRDDCVGETLIDVEERLMATCLATGGLPQTYTTEHLNAWHLQLRPRQLLEQLCQRHGLPDPEYSEDPANAWVRTALPGYKGRRTFFCNECRYP